MPNYRVTFTMDVEADDAEQAAYDVAETLAEGDPFMGLYDVTDADGDTVVIQPGWRVEQ